MPDNLSTPATQETLARMPAGQPALLPSFLDAGELPGTVGYEFVDTGREALTDLVRIAEPPEDILLALTQGGMPGTVQDLPSRFRIFVDEQTKGKDPNKVRMWWSRKMSPLWPDAHPDVERLQIERLRQMPAWRKMALMAEMGQSVRTLALAGLRQRYPADTPAQRRRRLADLLLGPELATLAYGQVPEEG